MLADNPQNNTGIPPPSSALCLFSVVCRVCHYRYQHFARCDLLGCVVDDMLFGYVSFCLLVVAFFIVLAWWIVVLSLNVLLSVFACASFVLFSIDVTFLKRLNWSSSPGCLLPLFLKVLFAVVRCLIVLS